MNASNSRLTPAARFGRAAAQYEAHARVQRHAAAQLAERIAGLRLPPRPRILEIGCGTGLLTRELGRRLETADWTITDLAPAMLEALRQRVALAGTVRYAVLDGEHPSLDDAQGYDLICSSLAVQWFGDLNAGLARLCRLLAPGGHLAVATLADQTFHEWRRVHAELGLDAGARRYPPLHAIGSDLPAMQGGASAEMWTQQYANGLQFLHSLKGIGATAPATGTRPLPVAHLRRVLRRFDDQGATVTYHLAYGVWQKAERRPAGVFVTGTDTGVGKTLVSAVLARAWNADYWKPLQTGIAEEPGDTETVARLAQLPAQRLHAPAWVLHAPLSPWAAAALEQVEIDASSIQLPATDAPLIVEGAGGLYVPVDDQHMMIDLIARLGLPVVLAARSTLGTINHTLLSLHALRARAIPVLGVVMSGPLSPGNRQAIMRFGQVPVLAEIPPLEHVDAACVARIAQTMPSLQHCLQQLAAPAAPTPQ